MKDSHFGIIRKFGKVLLLALPLIVVALYNNCSQSVGFSPAGFAKVYSTTIGNPLTSLAVTKYSQENTTQNSDVVTDLLFCINRLDLQSSNLNASPIRLDFTQNQEMTILSTGVTLESLPIPPGQYTQISMELADVCGTGRSINVVNKAGSFETFQPITLQFNGNVVIGDLPQVIYFSIQPLVDNLSLVTSDNNLPTQAQANAGSFALSSCISNYPSAVLADNPLSYWRLNETSGATAFDLGSGKNNAVYETTTTLGQSPPFAGLGNYSASSGTYIANTSPTNNLNFGGTNTLTIEYWAKTNDLTPGHDLVFWATDAQGKADAGYSFGLGSSGCTPTQFAVFKGGGILICIDGYVQDASWHYYVMSSGPAGIQIYVDGKLAGTSPDTQNYSSCAPWCPVQFGSHTATSAWFAETAIYPTALTAARVQAHLNSSSSCY